MMKQTNVSRAVLMAMTGGALAFGAMSGASAAVNTMYNLTTAGGADNSTNTTDPATGGAWGLWNGATDGWIYGLTGSNPDQSANGTNSIAEWAGTTGANHTPFGYVGAHLHWAVDVTGGAGGSGEISTYDSFNRYGVYADIDAAGGAWSDNISTNVGVKGGWRHDLDFGLFRSDATGKVRISVTGIVNSGNTNYGFTIFEGVNTNAAYNHHGAWNSTTNDGGLTNNSVPGGGTTLPVSAIIAYSVGDPATNIGTIEFNAEAGKIYTIAVGGFRTSDWTTTNDGYRLTFTQTIGGGGASRDFNGDGKADLVWRNRNTGANALWLMNGATRTSTGKVPRLAKANEIAAVDYFSPDLNADLLFRNPATGQNQIWVMNASTPTDEVNLPDQAPGFSVAGTDDFSGDGAPDILWFNATTGETSLWVMNATEYASTAPLPSAPTGSSPAGIGDCNGDGSADVLWRDATSGANIVWLMSGAAYGSTVSIPNQPAAWVVAGIGNFDSDGKCDILWRNTRTGQNQLWLMDGASRKAIVKLPRLAKAWVAASVDDFDGDGDPDILFRNPNTGGNNMWIMDGTKRSSKSAVNRILKAWSTPAQ